MSLLDQILSVLDAPGGAASPTPSCAASNDVCRFVFNRTGSASLATGSHVLLVKPLTILAIIVIALAIRFLINRTITRVVQGTTKESAPPLLKPLREKVPHALRDATGVMPERRRQRAEALGSVLRSITSAVIFVIAVMQVLSELGIDLAPLLASAGIAGLAIGFGAQNLVKDFITGMFMLLEDQYGVGNVVDLGQASGTVESVGLRITTIRDGQGVVWYIRNGEIVRVGNKSQGWALVIIDVPVGFAGIEEATGILRRAAAGLTEDPQWADDLIEDPEVLGVEQITVDGAVLRTQVKTVSEARWRVGREMRRRLTEALEAGGIAAKLGTGRVILHSPLEVNGGVPAAGAGTGTAAADGGPFRAPAPPRTGVTSGAPAATAAGDGHRARRAAAEDDQEEQKSADDAMTSAATTPEVGEDLSDTGRGIPPG